MTPVPIRSHQIPGGSLVVLRTCDGCGSTHAPWGTGSINEAIRTKDPGKVKCWCGPTGCAEKSTENANG